MPETFLLQAADQVAADSLHRAFGAAFADYLIGPFDLPAERWPQFLARQGVDLALSRVALRDDGTPLAFALVAARPRHGRWRLATMGAVPGARGSGAAPALLDELLARATQQGQHGLELEVFAQNARAAQLYRSRGFVQQHALHGYEFAGSPVPADDGSPVQGVDRDAAMAWLDAAEQRLPDLPLQVTATALAAAPGPLLAWQHGSAQLVASGGAPGPLQLLSLVDLDPAQHDARLLVRTLLARHPGAAVRVPQLQRGELGGEALRDAGFTPTPLHQWWMLKTLTPG